MGVLSMVNVHVSLSEAHGFSARYLARCRGSYGFGCATIGLPSASSPTLNSFIC